MTNKNDRHGGAVQHCNNCGDELSPVRQNTGWETCMDCDGLDDCRRANA